jgi:dolichol-phosphate hexosyltransferase
VTNGGALSENEVLILNSENGALQYSDVSVVIPTLNETNTIGSVIASIRKACAGAEVIVVDGQSGDGTAEAAHEAGADVVISEPSPGYGKAIRTGLDHSTRPVVAMCDGDGTYDISVLPWLIQLARGGQVGVGCRFHSKPQAMSVIRYAGNKIISIMLRALRINIADSQSGLKTFPRVLSRFLVEEGMTFSTEVLLRGRAHGLRIIEVTTNAYHPRSEGSSSKLRVMKDGLSIVAFVFREASRMGRQ